MPAAGQPPPPDAAGEDEFFECLLCSEPIQSFGIFNCCHFVCDTCALRMRTFSGANAHVHHAQNSNANAPTYRGASRHPVASLCPVCRAPVTELVLTHELPPNDDAYTPEGLKQISDRAIPGGNVHARIDGEFAKSRVQQLIGFFCPLEECWQPDPVTGNPSQEPFVSFDLLKEHLRTDHSMRYCKMCLDNRPAFLAEQRVYTDAEMDQHHKGKCKKDPESFAGHPQCLFCRHRFYEGDALLKHMIQGHFTCDLCNSNEFIFNFYQDRAALDRHFQQRHLVCKHRDCAQLNLMERVFVDEIALHAHMSRVHGEKSQLSAASLGFNFSGTPAIMQPGAAGAGRSSPQPAGRLHSGPANAANTHADRITFDFVTYTKDVFTTAVGRGDEGGRGRRAGGNQDNQGSLVELRKRLNAMLQEHLTEPQRVLMQDYTRSFLDGRSKAAEYFERLQSLFPDPELLNAVFAPLAATFPDVTKREALTAAKTMLTSAEAMRHKKNLEEEATRRRAEEARAATRAIQQSRQTTGKGQQSSARAGAAKAAGPKGAWTKAKPAVGNTAWQAAAAAAPPSCSGTRPNAAPLPSSSGSKAPAAAPASHAPPSLGWGAGASSGGPAGAWGGSSGGAASSAPTFLDPEAFPTLGGGSGGGGGGKSGSAARAAKPAPKSAWGRR